MSDAFYIVSHLFTGVGNFFTHLTTYAISLNIVEIKKTIRSIFHNQSPRPVLSALGLIGFLEAIHFVQRYGSIRQMLSKKPTWFRWCVYYAVAIALLFLGKFNTKEFIYFQF